MSKRAFDLVGACAALVVTGPVVALAAAATRVELGPPPFERVLRAGRGGEPFAMWHLRTHARTELGAWLRATGVATLPALWNVLRGDMSLVGPRPLHPQYADLTPGRHALKPGVTGWAQLHGGDDRSWDDEQALDRWYLEHASLTVDAMILTRAVLDRLRRPGDGEAATPGHDSDGAPTRPAAVMN
ncbi:MAG: sugar transferase [Myxococcales bacterium]|nr:sugar transferase [Myxococcales bacterium]